MPPSLTLGRVRLAVQIIMLFVTVWGSALVGHYAADKISGALPALSCAYDQQDGAYCVLIPTQHQLHHRVGEALVKAQQVGFQIILPLLLTFASFFAFFFFLGKAFCGWVCPLGSLQEWVGKLGRRLGLPVRRFGADGDLGDTAKLRSVKWLLLLGLVFILPLLTGMGITPHSLGNPYCDICPSRIATTLLTGSTEQVALNTQDGWSFALGALADSLIGFTLVGGLALRQPFCRICPLLAFNAVFKRLSPARLVKPVQHERCDKCGICAQACPMDIHEIHREHGSRAYHDDCTLCGRCAEFCPQDDVIQIKWGPWRLFGSSRDYYKARARDQQADGTVKPVKFVKPGRSADHV